MQSRAIKKSLALLAFTSALTFTQASHASFILMLDDLNDSVAPVYLYDATPQDLNTEMGVVTFSGAVGAFNVNVTTGISKPLFDIPSLDLNSIDVNGKNTGTLRIGITDTDFTGSFAKLNASLGGTTQGLVNFNFLYDSANMAWGGSSFASKTVTGPSFSNDLEAIIGGGSAPYSLTIYADITHHSKFQTTSFDTNIIPALAGSSTEVPLPASVWLFMSSLTGLFFYGRKKSIR